VLQSISFQCQPGEVIALVGENGAGKSTLSKIVSGLERADGGAMALDGNAYSPINRRNAEALGVRMVTQELALVENLSVAENLMLGQLPQNFGFLNRKILMDQANQCLADIGLGHIDPRAPISSLGIGQRQMIEISRGLMGPCKLLILDEPTASLTPHEAAQLFAHIDKLKQQGTTIIYISHRFEELRQIADRAIILRDGRVVVDQAMDSLSDDAMIKAMVGADLILRERHIKQQRAPVALEVEHLSDHDRISDVSFQIHEGEIFGLAGLVGAGCTELLRLIYGADTKTAGCVRASEPLLTISDSVRCGVGFVTEDRKSQGLFMDQSVQFNITVSNLGAVSWFGWISRGLERLTASHWIDRLRIRCKSQDQKISELSGGNQQKAILARQLFRGCKILLLDEPTRGVDIGARADLYAEIDAAIEANAAVLMVSSDLRELMSLCDRIGVMSGGRLVKIFDAQDFSEQALLAAAFDQVESKLSKMDRENA
jgi:ribose transport system ATP-binding protein